MCLSSTDGQIIGGGVGGPLKAAGPVQVLIFWLGLDNGYLNVILVRSWILVTSCRAQVRQRQEFILDFCMSERGREGGKGMKCGSVVLILMPKNCCFPCHWALRSHHDRN